MWHASIGSRGLSIVELQRLAANVLSGVGSIELGEWDSVGASEDVRVYHLRRRLTLDEGKSVGKVRDIRGTLEESSRVKLMAVRLQVDPAFLYKFG